MGKALAAWLMVATAMAGTTGPREVVQSAVNRVLAVVEESEASVGAPEPVVRAQIEHRHAEIRRIASELFDFDDMARRTLTRHWAARTPEERTEFVHLFTGMLERSYIGKIESYSGERIVYTGEVVDGDFATVRSRVITRRRSETALDYRLALRDGRWKVYDVLVDGVSFVSTYRAEFNRIIQVSSYASLVEKMRRSSIQAIALERAAHGL